jgi:UDP-2,4-diacetamido-2,4,6-trideoxy-beta-L-altropyranose hydrolase
MKNTLKIVFRTDASLKIGTGHVMRCLTLAHKLKQNDADCQFICRAHEGNLLKKIHNEGFKVTALTTEAPTSYEIKKDEEVLDHAYWLDTHWRVDADQTIQALHETPDWLIVDNYALDANWEITVRPHCKKIMVIDDLADRKHDCDLLLDQNLIKGMEFRYNNLHSASCISLLGPNYALLQSQYERLHEIKRLKTNQVSRIFVFFGGFDNHNLTSLVISAFLDLERPDITLDVVINQASLDAPLIIEQTQNCNNINLHNMLPSLAPLILNADLAIGAGGVNSWERCCLGLPSLVITTANNQQPIATELDRRSIVRYLGHHDCVTKPMLTNSLKDFLDNESISDWSNRCWDLVDAKGAERIASYLLVNSHTQLKTRIATKDDEELLLRWSNDSLVRKNALNPKIINSEEHHKWFEKRLYDASSCKIFIIETEKGFPIGNVRFELADESWEISFALDPFARGKGLGNKMVETSIKAFQEYNSKALLIGRVKKDNLPSKKIFENMAFTISESTDEESFYRYFLRLN